MIIMGIDPGIGRTGWGIIRIQNSEFRIQNSGCVETPSGMPMEQRLYMLYEQVEKLVQENRPDVLAVEDLFFNTNAKTALIVGQARGVVLLVSAQKNISLAVYTPLQVKIAITGYGRAEKRQIGQMVKTILHLPTIPKPDDVSDALAVALTHAFSYKTPR